MANDIPIWKAPTASVELSPTSARIAIEDGRPEVVGKLQAFDTEQQAALCAEAWSIGARALLNAHAFAEEAKLADVGRTLVADLERSIRAELAHQQWAITSTLTTYLDPTEGHLGRRIDELVKAEGPLARVLQQHVGGDHSVLARTLATAVGAESPLFKKLSPTESDGLIQLLENRIAAALEENRDAVARALDPLHKDGAVARFLVELKDQLEGADEGRRSQLDKALAALDQNDDNSLISKLDRDLRSGHQQLRNALDPTLPESPLALVKRTLEEALNERFKQQDERAREEREEDERHRQEVREAIARFEVRKAEQAKSTAGGVVFEDAVIGCIQSVVPTDCILDQVGTTVGLRPNCKHGDVVIRFVTGAFAGAGVVVEAKHDKAYRASDAIAELDSAMQNRDCAIGVFVMAKSRAGSAFERFARFGNKILVVWDHEDPISDGMLRGAVAAALVLAQRRRSAIEAGDLQALAQIEQRIFREIERLERMDDSARKITKEADKIADEVRKARGVLNKLVDDAKATLTALNVELRDDALEEQNPITLPQA